MSLRRLTYQLSSPSKIPPQILGGWGLYSQKGIMMYRKLFKRLPDRLAEAYIDFYFTLECRRRQICTTPPNSGIICGQNVGTKSGLWDDSIF